MKSITVSRTFNTHRYEDLLVMHKDTTEPTYDDSAEKVHKSNSKVSQTDASIATISKLQSELQKWLNNKHPLAVTA